MCFLWCLIQQSGTRRPLEKFLPYMDFLLSKIVYLWSSSELEAWAKKLNAEFAEVDKFELVVE